MRPWRRCETGPKPVCSTTLSRRVSPEPPQTDPMLGGAVDAGASTPDGLPPLREVITRCELTARKSLGQNFLLDLNLTRRIARAAGPFEPPNDQVVEIGPGPGGLTRALLLEGARRVIVIERDQRCLPALAEIAERWPGRLVVLEGDALETDPRPHLEGGVGQIVANLPYNVGTELLVRWLRGAQTPGGRENWPSWWTRLTLMFQREVAERIVAAPRSKAYGRLSVLAQHRAVARIVFDVSPRAFTPPPKITSSIVQLIPHRDQTPEALPTLETLEAVTAAAFAQRRKMLRASLKGLAPDIEDLLSSSGTPATQRADATTLDQYREIAHALARTRNGR